VLKFVKSFGKIWKRYMYNLSLKHQELETWFELSTRPRSSSLSHVRLSLTLWNLATLENPFHPWEVLQLATLKEDPCFKKKT